MASLGLNELNTIMWHVTGLHWQCISCVFFFINLIQLVRKTTTLTFRPATGSLFHLLFICWITCGETRNKFKYNSTQFQGAFFIMVKASVALDSCDTFVQILQSIYSLKRRRLTGIGIPIINLRRPGGRLNINMSSYQNRDPHVKDKTVSRPSYL